MMVEYKSREGISFPTKSIDISPCKHVVDAPQQSLYEAIPVSIHNLCSVAKILFNSYY